MEKLNGNEIKELDDNCRSSLCGHVALQKFNKKLLKEELINRKMKRKLG